ncbi:MAG: curli production assembly protein CsgG [bacterium]|nr:curli production assembly protein CsgG [bacterium]
MRILASLALTLMIAVAPLAAQQKKKRVAIMDFDYATVHSHVSAIFGSNVDVGRGITDLLVDRLVTSGVYSVIERKALDTILAEQEFSNSNRANPTSAAQIGKVLGVDTIIIGSITQFGRDDKSTNLGGFGTAAGRFGLGGIGRKKAKAVVGISARMIDVDTAEILGVAKGKGESTRSGTSLVGRGGSWGSRGGGNIDMGSSNFSGTILGEAVSQAVDEVAKGLDGNAGKLSTRTVKIEGLVADATGGILVLNVGTRAGVKVGDRLLVKRAVREIKDPATGAVLRKITQAVGEVTITEADEVSSVGTFSGATPAAVGDMVSNE